MTIPDTARPEPLPPLLESLALVERDGRLSETGLLTLRAWREYINGSGRRIPCSASGTNLITLTPNDASPLLEKYTFGDSFLFWAENTSTGDVTITVTPDTGLLTTLKAYKADGATQATTGDVVANSVYEGFYAPHLDSNAGGIVLK